MRNIFVSGASGVLGKRVVKLLLREGLEVTGLSRSRENTVFLTELGARARRANLFDVNELITTMAGCDAILHLATAIPTEVIPKKPRHWAMNDKIRVEGTKALLEAARVNRISCFIQQSVTRIYGDRKGKGLKPGVEFYFEEYIGGQQMKKTVRFTKIESNRYIEFEPTWWLMRLFMPRLSFEIEPKENGCLFIAKIPIRTGPIGAWLNRREFSAVKKHMEEEGKNLKKILEDQKSV